MILNDLVVVERPADAKFIKALAVVASVLHPAYDEVLPHADKSKESCVLCSLTVRDFLWTIGFKDAKVTTCYLVLQAVDGDGKEVHSAGVGDHGSGRVPIAPDVSMPRNRHGYWNGHMVVEVPSVGYVIDTTLFHMKRPQWPLLPGMIAAPIDPPSDVRSYGMEHMAGIASDQGNGLTLRAGWLREPNPSWRGASDTNRALRLPVVRALRAAFGPWRS